MRACARQYAPGEWFLAVVRGAACSLAVITAIREDNPRISPRGAGLRVFLDERKFGSNRCLTLGDTVLKIKVRLNWSLARFLQNVSKVPGPKS